MVHGRTVSNFIWTVIVLAGIAAAAYYLLPIIGGWISGSMGHRQTMGRPSGIDASGGLPNK
jgi:hypothetical protein